MKDKKKTIVLIALAVVILAVGAFQFVGGSSVPTAPVTAKPKDAKTSDKAVAPDEKKQDEPKNALFAANLPARDPFQSDVAAPQPVQQQPPTPTPPQPRIENRAPRLPDGMIDKLGSFGTAPVTVQAVPEPQFSFTLGGVMLGAKPMAVFRDGQGNERLVMLGGSLDPDSKVVSIDKDAVTVRFHGKAIKLTVEGNPNAK